MISRRSADDLGLLHVADRNTLVADPSASYDDPGRFPGLEAVPTGVSSDLGHATVPC